MFMKIFPYNNHSGVFYITHEDGGGGGGEGGVVSPENMGGGVGRTS